MHLLGAVTDNFSLRIHNTTASSYTLPTLSSLKAPHRTPDAVPGSVGSLVRDLPVVLVGLALFYGLLSLAHYWAGPVNTQAKIQLYPSKLPEYAFFSVARIAVAYFISFAVTLVYGYIAAHNAKAERFLIPLLDTLQSIPVLSFLPGVMVSMVALFPTRQLGVELGSILLIFTGQVWNMTFSAYSSFKSIPSEMLEAATLYRLSWWQRFTQLELPYAAIGLVWNSIMSVAGGWFFLMACEMFILGNRDLRLPGLGSYLQTASNAGDIPAIWWGLGAMISVIILIDQLIWRPLIVWSEKFKFEQVEASATPDSPVLDLLRRSKILSRLFRATVEPASEALTMYFAKRQAQSSRAGGSTKSRWLGRVLLAGVVLAVLYAIARMIQLLAALSLQELRSILVGAGATFLRVEFTLLLAALWTVPVGVYVGLRPRISAFIQPVAQVAASVPATALFPIIIMVLIQAGGGMQIGSIVLLLLGTQWYILFNVIAGASAIPADLKEVCEIFRLRTVERWRKLLLPAIFPYLLTGFVTASGGAWNASIVAEYFRFHGQTISTTGLGAVISRATDTGNLPVLLGATVVMAAMVVVINRLLWRRLYVLAGTKFKLES
jgi:NitT/TauT family transport system permease protein